MFFGFDVSSSYIVRERVLLHKRVFCFVAVFTFSNTRVSSGSLFFTAGKGGRSQSPTPSPPHFTTQTETAGLHGPTRLATARFLAESRSTRADTGPTPVKPSKTKL